MPRTSLEITRVLGIVEIILCSTCSSGLTASRSVPVYHGVDKFLTPLLQTLTTKPKNAGQEVKGRSKSAKEQVETRHVVEYLVVDFRTWAWKGNLKFVQQVYPGQKLDVVTYEMSEEKLMERMREKKRREQEEDGVVEEGEAERIEREGKIAPTNA